MVVGEDEQARAIEVSPSGDACFPCRLYVDAVLALQSFDQLLLGWLGQGSETREPKKHQCEQAHVVAEVAFAGAEAFRQGLGPGESGCNREGCDQYPKQGLPDRSFCIVNEWIWLDLDAPGLVVNELESEGKKPVMLLMLNVVFDSSTKSNSPLWLRSSPLIDFSEGMFFQTQHKLYVLLNHGRRKTMSLSAVVRAF